MRQLIKISVVLTFLFGSSLGDSIISSPLITNWGIWGDFSECPLSTSAQGFQLKTEKDGYNDGDETALNGIRLFCGDYLSSNTENVASLQGAWGRWGANFTCEPNQFLTGFQLRSEAPPSVSEDETAANNVRFFCSFMDSVTPQNTIEYIEGDGREWGNWSPPQHCPAGETICGIKTQVEPKKRRNGDMTALNNVEMKCCTYV